ncbi:MAG: WbqC family protein [Acidobacteriota bacterium]
MKTLAAHQPQYLPWLGFFDKLDRADIFVLLDNVQFKKNEWQNRNRIKTSEGWQWLTVPVRHRFPQSIAEVKIDQQAPWERKHLQALQSNYGKATHFDDTMRPIRKALGASWGHLAALNTALIRGLATALGIDTPLVLASTLTARAQPNDRLIDLCTALEADTYLSGPGASGYLDVGAFENAGISVRFQQFDHPVYPQLYGPFEANLSVVDLLMNCGGESLSVIRSVEGR